MQPIHLNLPPVQQQQDPHKQQCFTGPSPPISLIPRSSKGIPSLPRQSILASPHPCHSARLPLHILCPLLVSKAGTVCPGEKNISFTCLPLPHSPVLMPNQRKLRCQQHLALHQPHLPCLRRSWKLRALALQTARPVLPHTHFAPGCLSHTTRQPSADYKEDHGLRSATTCPYPSPAIMSTVRQHRW